MQTVKHALLSLIMLILASGTLFAQNQRVSDREVNPAPAHIHPNIANTANLNTIFSNLGSKTDTYDQYGFYVRGPNLGTQWEAMPFTPKADATVTQIQAAVLYDGTGTNGFELVLAADAGYGFPGKTLHRWYLKNLANVGTCCELATAKYADGVKVERGKQYWVVARTNAKTAGTQNVWAYTWNETEDGPYIAYTHGAGWIQDYAATWCAFAVRGKY
jgi:hypothetical protein